MERWILSTTLPDTEKYRKLIEAGIRHDWVLYHKNGMEETTVAEWLRFLLNRRLSEISQGRL